MKPINRMIAIIVLPALLLFCCGCTTHLEVESVSEFYQENREGLQATADLILALSHPLLITTDGASDYGFDYVLKFEKIYIMTDHLLTEEAYQTLLELVKPLINDLHVQSICTEITPSDWGSQYRCIEFKLATNHGLNTSLRYEETGKQHSGAVEEYQIDQFWFAVLKKY